MTSSRLTLAHQTNVFQQLFKLGWRLLFMEVLPEEVGALLKNIELSECWRYSEVDIRRSTAVNRVGHFAAGLVVVDYSDECRLPALGRTFR